MDESFLACGVVWADADLLEIRVRVRFGGWAGDERAYVTRAELLAFADALTDVAAGTGEAVLVAGQPDLSFVQLRTFAYGLNPRLGMEARLGRVADTIVGRPAPATELRLAFPIEVGGLAHFVERLRDAVRREQGEARLALPRDWP